MTINPNKLSDLIIQQLKNIRVNGKCDKLICSNMFICTECLIGKMGNQISKKN